MRIVALDIGGTVVKSALFEDGRLLEIKEAPSVTETESCIEVNAAMLANTYSDFDAVGVAITGQIDTEKQTRLFVYGMPTDAEGAGYPAGKILADNIGKPVFLINDANAAAVGEAIWGAGKSYDSVILLTYGTGVGGGIVMNGKVFGGKRGIAGEFGHMVIHAGGKRVCGCGKRGCYESYASTTALVKSAQKFDPSITNGKEFFAKYNGDPNLKKVFDKWVADIVEGLCSITYIFNPPCIILGGGVMEREDVLNSVRRKFLKRVIPTFSRVDIIPAKLKNRAGLYGAYAYACERLNIPIKK